MLIEHLIRHDTNNIYFLIQSSNHQFQSPYSSRPSQTLIYNSEVGGSVMEPQPNRQIGSVHDMDPVNHNYGSLGMGRVYR